MCFITTQPHLPLTHDYTVTSATTDITQGIPSLGLCSRLSRLRGLQIHNSPYFIPSDRHAEATTNLLVLILCGDIQSNPGPRTALAHIFPVLIVTYRWTSVKKPCAAMNVTSGYINHVYTCVPLHTMTWRQMLTLTGTAHVVKPGTPHYIIRMNFLYRHGIPSVSLVAYERMMSSHPHLAVALSLRVAP